LHYSVQGKLDLAAMLIANGADINAADDDGDTPLHLAAMMGYQREADLLLAHDAGVNTMNKKGMTALHYAVLNGHREIADSLRNHGAADQ